MKRSIENFLEFNGKNLIFLQKDGVYYIALQPICEALGANPKAQIRAAKNDEILGDWCTVQYLSPDGKKAINYVCLPEKYIYGWLLWMRVENPSKDYIEYKKKCYDILHDYFHGTITQRQNLLKTKTRDEIEEDRIRDKFKTDPDFQKFLSIQRNKNMIGRELSKLDREYINSQMELWQQDFALNSDFS